MDIRFTASESVAIPVESGAVEIQHYLRQPERLVKAIADPKLIEQLSVELFMLKIRPLNFMEIYYFQPFVILKVWRDSNGNGTVYLRSQSCEIKGLEYINQRFSLNLQGKLCPRLLNGQTYLEGKADLAVTVELPPPLWLTPKPLLEFTGNGLLKSVLLRIKQRLLSQLLQDYHEWASGGREDPCAPTKHGLKFQ